MTQPTIKSLREPRPNARLQLFCLPHAGGSVSYYVPWQKLLPDFIELTLLQLPGRGISYKDPLIDTWPEAITATCAAISQLRDDRPFAIFGHSLGALIGFEVAYRLQHENLSHLFVSGMQTPVHYHLPELRYTLSDENLIKYVATTDDATLNKDENYFSYLRFAIPAVRADFKLVDTYEHQQKEMLTCPVAALYGQHDALYSEEEVLGWKEVTNDGFEFKKFPGGHMYLSTARVEVLEYLVKQFK